MSQQQGRVKWLHGATLLDAMGDGKDTGRAQGADFSNDGQSTAAKAEGEVANFQPA